MEAGSEDAKFNGCTIVFDVILSFWKFRRNIRALGESVPERQALDPEI